MEASTMTDQQALIEAKDDLEKVKTFLGSIIVMRGYGQDEYDGVLRTLKLLDAAIARGSCQRCEGTGYEGMSPSESMVDCRDCKTTGKAPAVEADAAKALELFPDKNGNGGFIQDLCYTVWEKCHNPTHEDGKTDWFTDTLPTVRAGIEKIRAALASPVEVEAVDMKKALIREHLDDGESAKDAQLKPFFQGLIAAVDTIAERYPAGVKIKQGKTEEKE